MFKGLKALLAGVIAGTALGVLFAPKKGEEMRKNIKNSVKSGGTGIGEITGAMSKMGKEIGDTIHSTYDEISGSETFKKGEKKLKQLTGKAKKGAEKFIKEVVPASKRKKMKTTIKKATNAAQSRIKGAEKAANKILRKINQRKKK